MVLRKNILRKGAKLLVSFRKYTAKNYVHQKPRLDMALRKRCPQCQTNYMQLKDNNIDLKQKHERQPERVLGEAMPNSTRELYDHPPHKIFRNDVLRHLETSHTLLIKRRPGKLSRRLSFQTKPRKKTERKDTFLVDHMYENINLKKIGHWWQRGPRIFNPTNYEPLINVSTDEENSSRASIEQGKSPADENDDLASSNFFGSQSSFDESDQSSNDTVFSRGGILKMQDFPEEKKSSWNQEQIVWNESLKKVRSSEPNARFNLMFSRHWRYRFDSSC